MFFVFLIYSILFLLSTIGFGFIFIKIIKLEKYTINFGTIGILGLFFLSVIASYSHIFFKHGYIHNIFLLLLGLGLFLYFNNKYRINFKILFTSFAILFIGFLLAKTNEDFPYYHLANSLQFSQQKLQFGLGNLNHGFKHITSLFMLNSINYYPLINYYLFNLVNFLFQIFFVCFLIIEVLNNSKIANFTKNFLILTLILLLVKFSRLAEYGTDIAGQIIIFVSIFFSLEILFNSKINSEYKIAYFKLLIILLVFTISTKVTYVIYSLIPAIVFFNMQNKIKALNSILQLRNLFIIILSITFLLFFNFSSTGCILYPIPETCFSETFDWSLKKETVSYMNYHYELWSKGGRGPDFEVSNPEKYVDGLNWTQNWISVYFFTKVSDFLALILIILLFYTSIFFREIFSEKQSKQDISLAKFINLYLALIIIFLIWFFNFPTLRYAGYVIIYLLFILPYCLSINNKIIWEVGKYKKFFFILIFCFSIFALKNSIRLYKEINIPEDQHHNFKNFPFYFVKNLSYKEVIINNNKVYEVLDGNMCWATPSTCVRATDKLNIKNKKGYKFYSYNDF